MQNVKTIWCQNRKNKIFGQLYLPDGKGPFPLVIYSHGYGYNIQLFSMEELARAGIAAYAFDFCGGSPWSKSDGKSTEMSVLTESADLEAVLDTMRQTEYIDEDKIYLCGNSQGGYISTLVGVRRIQDIQGLILYCPAYLIDEFRAQIFGKRKVPDVFRFSNMKLSRQYVEDCETIHIYEEMKRFNKKVLLYHGTADGIVPYKYSQKAADCFPEVEFITVQGAGHMLDGLEHRLVSDIVKLIH